jgi:prepilin-type N-terminal cleavage/methylation domain-containing protein
MVIKKGFTLVETIIVIVIIVLISAIGVASILTAADALSFLTVRTDMDQAADVAMSRMASEIIRLRDDQSIHADTDSSRFRFYDFDDTEIDYALSGTDLMRNTDILASNVSSINFKYYDDSGTQLTSPTVGIGIYTNIRRIVIILTFQRGNYQLTYQSQIRPRNLRHLSYKFQ